MTFRAGNYIRIKKAFQDFGQFDEILSLAGPKLDKKNVYAMFDKLKEISKENDTILIYWEGHGMSWPDDTSGAEQDNTHESLMLSTNVSKNGIGYPTNETVIQDDEFADLIRSLTKRNVILIIESCHSGGLFDSKALGSKLSLPFFLTNDGNLENIQKIMDARVSQDYNYNEFEPYVPPFFNFDDLKSNANTPISSNQSGELNDLLKSFSGKKYTGDRLMKKLENSTKDIHSDHPKLAAVVSCREKEVSCCPVLIPQNSEYVHCELTCGSEKLSVGPLTFSLLTLFTDTKGKYTKVAGKVDFEDFWNMTKIVVPVNATRIYQICVKEDPDVQKEQMPVYFNSIGEIYLKP